MERIFKSKNGVIVVTVPETCDRKQLMKETEEFLRKVIIRRNNNGNSDTSGNFREK